VEKEKEYLERKTRKERKQRELLLGLFNSRILEQRKAVKTDRGYGTDPLLSV
jgi:hypothetical protein